MDDKKYFEGVRARPGLYGLNKAYSDTVMFLNGFDQARSGGLMRGFTEWLVVRKGECSSFGWQALVLEEALPEIESWGWSKLEKATPEQEQKAIELLLSLLLEFLAVRDNVMALAGMYSKYHSLHSGVGDPGGE
ncbi:hypothetical protein [Streptomyces beigongshangae]|uniref:hypothetical protein n=1 Tax=Streptomyces beigongshangae TaxID=2841597 RepID=UPI001C853488|nr:hypothetical protein [Streptomyces sp. REN17]